MNRSRIRLNRLFTLQVSDHTAQVEHSVLGARRKTIWRTVVRMRFLLGRTAAVVQRTVVCTSAVSTCVQPISPLISTLGLSNLA